MEVSLSEDSIQEMLEELEEEQQSGQEPLSPDVEELLRELQSGSDYKTRREAAEQLAKLDASSPRIVQALLVANRSDSLSSVRIAAATALRASVHQEYLQQHPDLVEATKDPQGRIYPKPRLLERRLVDRIIGTSLALFGVWFLGWSLPSPGGDPARLCLALLGLPFIYLGLRVAGLELPELLGTLLHRRAWQGPQATAEGEIIDRATKKLRLTTNESGGGGYGIERHWITFRFPTDGGTVSLKALVDRSCYRLSRPRQPVEVRYVQQNPRLALLEWESD